MINLDRRNHAYEGSAERAGLAVRAAVRASSRDGSGARTLRGRAGVPGDPLRLPPSGTAVIWTSFHGVRCWRAWHVLCDCPPPSHARLLLTATEKGNPMKSYLYLSFLIALLAMEGACSSQKTQVPGKPCVINSDCQDPLSCSWGTCHEACRTDGDCAGGARCVWDNAAITAAAGSPAGDVSTPVRVCLTPTDDRCTYNSACASPLVCGRDLHCRNECLQDVDCASKTDKCVIGGMNGEKVCAEPGAIDATGVLAGAPDGGTSNGDGGMTTTDAGPAGACGTEQEPNDSPDSPMPAIIGVETVGCVDVRAGDDLDYYDFTAPAAPASGGYFRGSLTTKGTTALIGLRVNIAANNERVTATTSRATGGSFPFFWAAVAGQRYHVVVSGNDLGGPAVPYILKVEYTAVNDTYEPNDTRDAAKPIQVQMPVSAYMFTGFDQGSPQAPEYDDWFVVDLQAGPSTISVVNVPLNLRLGVTIFNMQNNVRVSANPSYGANAGASFDAKFSIVTPGKYYLQFAIDGLGIQAAGVDRDLIRDNFTRPYQFTVTQP